VRMEPSPKFALVNLALAWAGKTAVPLDPNLSDAELAKQRAACGVEAVITDIPRLSAIARAMATFALRWLPSSLTTAAHHHTDVIVPADEPVAFSYSNIQANITGLQEVFALGPQDAMTARVSTSDPLTFIQALWWPLLSGTPLRYEKSDGPRGSITVVKQREERFVINHDNAYVRAEMGGAVCVNTADVHYGNEIQRGSKSESMGRPLPGVAVRVVDPATGERVGPEKPGVLQIEAASMGGKINTNSIQDWFNTGDRVSLDAAGFLTRCNLSGAAGVSISERSKKE